MSATDALSPTVVPTSLGPVEYVAFGRGPAVLCLHGAMGGYDQSRILARLLGTDGYRFIAVSRPGYLGTPLASGASPEAQADLCAALLDRLDERTAAVLAISGGGPCALSFAAGHRERCRGLILCSTCGARIDTPLPLAYYVLVLLGRWPALARLLGRGDKVDANRMAGRSIPDTTQRRRVLDDPEVGGLFRELSASTSSRVPERLAGTRNDVRVTRSHVPPLAAVRVPTLVVHGDRDPYVPFARHARALAQGIAGAELLAIPGGGHACVFTHRALIRERVAALLAATAG